MGNVLRENRHGLIAGTELMLAAGTAERDAAIAMLGRLPGSKLNSLGAKTNITTRKSSWRPREG